MRPKSLDIDPNRSVWVSGFENDSPMPPLAGKTTADVAIIGGGFTGVSSAYHISRRFADRRVVLLEARALGNGASGRNGGQVLNWVSGHETADPERARLVWSATKEGIDGIEEIIRRHALPVRFSRNGCFQFYTDSRRAEAAHARIEKLSGWGLPLRWLDRAALARYIDTPRGVGATFDPTEGQLHGVEFLRAMRPVLLEQGVTIHEDTPVTLIREGRTCTLSTPAGQVEASAIILATDGYTPRLGYFKSGLFPLHSHMLATEPVSPEQRQALGWGDALGFSDDMDRISYGGLAPGGELMFGGGSNAAYSYLYGNRTQYPGSPDSAERSFRAIHRQFLDYFPRAASLRVTRRWTGTLGMTLSRVCSMGVGGRHRNVYHALGYSGHGITLANLAGRVLCDIYSGSDERWRPLPFYQRPLGGIPPEPLRWLGYHIFTRLTGRSPRKQA